MLQITIIARAVLWSCGETGTISTCIKRMSSKEALQTQWLLRATGIAGAVLGSWAVTGEQYLQ